MATNSRLFSFFLAVFLFLCLSSVFAQNSGYFIDTEGGRPRFIQRLAWSGGEFSLRYEVIIENRVSGTYRNYHREFTTELHIDISLQPGSYRFRVIPYDVLNRPGAASEWKYIEVLPALKPEISSVLPEYLTGGDGEKPLGFLLYLTGANLDPGAEVFLHLSDGRVIPAEMLNLGDGDGGTVIVFVESDSLIPDKYEVVVRNPGGLESSIGGVSLLPPETGVTAKLEPEEETAGLTEPGPYSLKPVMFGIGLALMPSFPVYGDSVKGGMAFYGLTARANLLFYIPIGVYIGPELSALAFFANYPDQNGEYFMYNFNPENIPDRFTLMIGVNLLVRKWFPGRRAALSFRVGADYGILPDWIDQASIRMDISFLWRLENNVLIEGGLDYTHMLSEISGGFFRPWLGIGFQF